jgi:hypothetical protein
MADQPIAADYPIPGVLVQVFDETSPVRLRVRSATELVAWTPFVTDPTHDLSRQVATTIKYQDVLYAIAKREQTPSGWQYDLIPWPNGEMARRTIALSREFWLQLEAEKRIEQEERRRDRIARGLGFLIAFLPASIQERISEEYDYDAPGWTKINSAVIGAIAAFSTLLNNVIMPIVAGFGYAAAPATGLTFWLFPYLLLDSFLRFGTAIAGDRPLGLLPVEILYWTFQKIRAIRRPQ